MVGFSGAAFQKWKLWGAVLKERGFALKVQKSRLVFSWRPRIAPIELIQVKPLNRL